MSGPKVFEYAKQVGMETLSLMDKLREWNIPVKNHMAELDSTTIALIEEKMNQESEAKAAPKTKKKTSRTAKKASSEKAQGVVKKKTGATKTNGKTAAGGTRKVVKRSTASKVIRRKASDVAKSQEEALAAEAAELAEQQLQKQQQAEAEMAAAQEEAKAKEVESVTEPTQESTTQSAHEASGDDASTQEETKQTTPTRSVKREVIPGSGPRTGANIVGRMDLNRAKEMQSRMSNRGAGGAGQRSTSPRPGGVSRPMRPGFAAAAPGPRDFIVEDVHRKDTNRKKGHKARAGGSGADDAAAAKGLEEVTEQFTASEFRKREMIFQPRKKKDTLDRPALKTEITTPKASKRIVKMYDMIKVSDFAREMGVKVPQLITTLIKNGVSVSMNDSIDYETAALIAPEFGYEVENLKKTSNEIVQEVAFGDLEAPPELRSPIVTVMGHVDHGKTSLLDAIRNADVASGEAGGITQHIGAYQVKTESGAVITFIDTPGHEAFTAMRARGANVTDIVILVVAADDGVMNQTIEAISHAKNAGVPIIVAVNKIDKPGANIQRIKQQLTEYELVAEEWGGTTVFCEVSALKRTGVKELLEQVYLQSEIMELKANPKRSGTGVIIESRLDKGRGVVVTMLVKDGTVKVGQYISAGASHGKVRALFDDHGKGVKEAGPSMPVEMLGLNEPPLAGDIFDVTPDEKSAALLSQQRKEEVQRLSETPKSKLSLEELFSKIQAGDVKELPIILKADVVGSLEALKGLLEKASTDKVKVKIIHSAVGGITESDILLASSAKGLVIGFNVRPDNSANSLAKSQGVEIKTYSIIYEVVDEVKKAMEGLLAPTIVEKTLGRAEVRNTFSVPKIGTIAGCSVVDGKISRAAQLRLIRDGRVIYEGKIGSLKRFKDDVKEVSTGYECGIGIENYNDLKVGDVIEAFEKQQVATEL